jgi:D-glycero-D-manno-heptose 1,7-bisphosphate phosphatase
VNFSGKEPPLLRNHKSRAVFLDRDGVINEILFHQNLGIIETPFTPGQFRLKAGVGRAIRQINRLGFKAVVISNQPGVAMGNFSRTTLGKITDKMKRLLRRENASLDAVYYCLHHPEKGKGKLKVHCRCRKPKAGLLRLAASELNLDLRRSYLVGDSVLDVQAGRSAGCTTLLLAHLKCDLCQLMARRGVKPAFLAKNLGEAVKKIQTLEKARRK